MKSGILTLVFTLLLSTVLLAACTSTSSASKTETPAGVQSKASVTSTETPAIADGQKEPAFVSTPDKKPTYGHDSAACVMHYNLYRQSFRDWENSGDMFYFEDLMPWWTWVFVNCPGYRLNTFINGIKVYEHRISIVPEAQKQGAIDTLMLIFDERILYFGEEPFVLGQKAAAMVKYYPQKTEKVFAILKRVVELNKLNTPNHLVVFYMQYAVNLKEAGKMTLEELIDVYLEVDEICNYNVELNNATSADYRESISRIEQLMLIYLDCQIMQEVFMPKYLADSTNLELNRKIMGLMAYKRCFDQPVFRATLNMLNRTEPTPKLLMIQGNFYFNDGNYSLAAESYTKAFESFTDKELNEKYDAAMKNAEIALVQKQYQTARTWAMRALSLKSDDPDALIMLGDIYLYGAGTCGTSIIAKYVGFWAAFDKYQRAKSLSNDPVIQSKANNGISNARRSFPQTSELFFNQLKPGQTVTAPCWIGETTTVRASDQ